MATVTGGHGRSREYRGKASLSILDVQRTIKVKPATGAATPP
jgi:hypothetical protein